MNKLLFASVCALGLGLGFASPASAEQVGADEVVLKNGGSIRGSVISVEPGQKVVLLEMGKREPREIPWAEVADVEKGKFGDGPRSEKGDKEIAADDESDEAPAKGRVKLHVESDEPVQVFERLGATAGAVGGYGFVMESFKEVCASPCDREIDGSRGQAFFIAGDGVPGSEAFYLNDKGGNATLKVDTGSAGQIWGGATMVTFGSMGLLGGAIMLPIGAAISDDLSDTGDTFVTAGAVSLGVGAALLAGGIVLIATGGTDVEWSDQKQAARIEGRPREVKPRYWLGEF